MVVLGTIGRYEGGSDEVQFCLEEAPADEKWVYLDLEADTSLNPSFLLSISSAREEEKRCKLCIEV